MGRFCSNVIVRKVSSGDLMYSMMSKQYCIVYLRVAKKVNLKCSHSKKKKKKII